MVTVYTCPWEKSSYGSNVHKDHLRICGILERSLVNGRSVNCLNFYSEQISY